MKIQQSTTKITAPKKPVAQAPQPDQSAATDSVEIGSQTRELETDIGRMYSLYRTSNSQYDQKNLKREMLARLDSSTGTLPAKIELQDLLTRLFTKNDKAWELKSQQGKPCPGTDVEFNSGKYDVAKGQPLCGDNLFNLGEWQRRKNLVPMLQPKDTKCKNVYVDIDHDLDSLGGSKKTTFVGGVANDVRKDLDLMGGSSTKRKIKEDLDLMGGSSTKRKIEDDLNLMGQKPQKRFHSDFAAHLFNRLA